MSIEKYLDEIEKIESKIANKRYEVERLKNVARGGSSSSDGERVQSSGSQKTMENAVVKYTDLEREIEELEQRMREFIQNIEKLPRKYYMVMHDYYIKGLTNKEINRMNGKKESWASTTKMRAKVLLSNLMWGDKGDM